MSLDTGCLIPDREVITRRIEGQMVFVPVKSGSVDLDFLYSSNETGAMIWEWIDGLKNVDQIVDAVSREFEVSPGQAARDVVEFVSALTEAGLVSPREGLK
ncbi:MAG: PqqD family protein [Acidobacteriota bacterium]